MAEKQKVHCLTLEQKVEVIKRLNKGDSCRKIAKDFGCGKTQVQSIKKQKDVIQNKWEEGNVRSDAKNINGRTTKYEDINIGVY